jgi:surfactin synthase thioesterase subunit
MKSISRAIKPRAVKIPQIGNAALEALAMPLLAIIGGRDALLDSYDTRVRLELHVPHAEVCFIEEGYHFLPNQSQRVFDFLVCHLQGQNSQTRRDSKSRAASDE